MAKKAVKKPAKKKATVKPKPKPIIEKRGKGRPTLYTQELATEFLLRMIMTNKGVCRICEDKDMPAMSSIFLWLNDKELDFSEHYARAKEIQAERLRDEIIDISDTPIMGKRTIKKKGGNVTIIGDIVERSKLMVDTRKFLIVKLAPKVYGNKAEVTHVNKEQPLFLDEEEDKE